MFKPIPDAIESQLGDRVNGRYLIPTNKFIRLVPSILRHNFQPSHIGRMNIELNEISNLRFCLSRPFNIFHLLNFKLYH
ncbi:hypothetical protein M413DRAFT_438926 [Hebeloma cylindrosporum]|uniref:Uncharacterized protein n=1 Tax=Hebeloma cylindrosporum TaxID=76867 RepID=A0A0C3D0Z9_HEBCY|nr:hypothetical protein M413DRAFT_438926 [Hebeloma cylindrosporum h7]